jgi:orotate phosphoribosyltransferase-like protein
MLEAHPAPLYQRIGREARQLEDLGLSRHRIAEKLEVADRTVARAITWHRSLSGGIEG